MIFEIFLYLHNAHIRISTLPVHPKLFANFEILFCRQSPKGNNVRLFTILELGRIILVYKKKRITKIWERLVPNRRLG